MGFTTGFLASLAFTTTTAYLTLSYHKRNRTQQSASLRLSKYTLDSVVDSANTAGPTLSNPDFTTHPLSIEHAISKETSKVYNGGLAEALKDRWNREIQGLFTGLRERDWRATREQAEDIGVGVWRGVRRSFDNLREGSKNQPKNANQKSDTQ